MKNIWLFILIMHLGSNMVAQEKDPSDSVKLKKSRPSYISLGAGFHVSKFRDFATSPLFYHGLGTAFSIGSLKMDDRVESAFVFQNLNGTHVASVGNEIVSASFNQSLWSYTYLRSIKRLSQGKWNFKGGAVVNALLNVRQNESLFNNSFGLESINTLFASAKATLDISRSQEVIKKLLFLKIKLKPKSRDISFRTNVGLMNNNLRNGYAYLNQSWIVSDDSQVLDGYNYSFFSGMRLISELNYTRYLTNGNAYQFTFSSDLYNTGDVTDRFEAAHYTFKFILLYRTK